MTREEAKKIVRETSNSKLSDLWVDVFAGLGLLKFDEPDVPDDADVIFIDTVNEWLYHGSKSIMQLQDNLRTNGVKVVLKC